MRYFLTATSPLDDCATPEVFECTPYNENARLMTTMFRQQLINCETFLHASPSEICLRLTVWQCARCKRARTKGKGVRERRRQREDVYCCGTLFERVSASCRDGKQKYTGPLCAQVECAHVRGLHGDECLLPHTCVLQFRESTCWNPRAFKLRVHFHADSTPLVPHREGRFAQTMIRSFRSSDRTCVSSSTRRYVLCDVTWRD